MMKAFVLTCISLASLFVLNACGSVVFSSNNSFNATEEGQSGTVKAVNSNVDNADNNAGNTEALAASDCDAYMESLANTCFNTTVFDENGLLLNDVDENGNVLGPVDQNWARAYCNCFAQRSFQEYGCVAVQADESIDNDAWLNKYDNIRNACAETLYNEAMSNYNEAMSNYNEATPDYNDANNDNVMSNQSVGSIAE